MGRIPIAPSTPMPHRGPVGLHISILSKLLGVLSTLAFLAVLVDGVTDILDLPGWAIVASMVVAGTFALSLTRDQLSAWYHQGRAELEGRLQQHAHLMEQTRLAGLVSSLEPSDVEWLERWGATWVPKPPEPEPEPVTPPPPVGGSGQATASDAPARKVVVTKIEDDEFDEMVDVEEAKRVIRAALEHKPDPKPRKTPYPYTVEPVQRVAVERPRMPKEKPKKWARRPSKSATVTVKSVGRQVSFANPLKTSDLEMVVRVKEGKIFDEHEVKVSGVSIGSRFVAFGVPSIYEGEPLYVTLKSYSWETPEEASLIEDQAPSPAPGKAAVFSRDETNELYASRYEVLRRAAEEIHDQGLPMPPVLAHQLEAWSRWEDVPSSADPTREPQIGKSIRPDKIKIHPSQLPAVPSLEPNEILWLTD